MVSPVLAGSEPFSFQGSPEGVLVMHGFTGTPQSLRPVAEALADAGYSVELPLWPGHGTAIEDMIPTRWEDWSGAAEAAYEDLAARCDSVGLFGLSMGGTLACWLASRHLEVRGMVLVNPLVQPIDKTILDLLDQLESAGEQVAPGIGSDIALQGAQELAYTGTPIAAVKSLSEAAAAVEQQLGAVSCPVLLLQSREDHVVPAANGDAVVAGVGGPVERVWLERSYHVATLDHDRDEIIARSVEFFASVLGRPS